MVLFFFIIAFCLSVPGPAHAQAPLDEDTNRFGQVLTELKVSADQLTKGNTELIDRNNALRNHLSQLQARMQKLVEDHDALMAASAKLQAENPGLSRRIERLENEADDLSARATQLTAEQKAAEETIRRAREESEKLGTKMVELDGKIKKQVAVPPGPDPDSEKLRLLKMIDDSKEQQAYLYKQIADIQQNLPVTSVVSVQVPKDKDSLVNQAQRLQEEVEQLTKMANRETASDEVDEAQLSQLQDQMDTLQKNHDQLADLVGRMQQKVKKGALTKDQQTERNRLKESLADLENEARRLKMDLHDLRRQMVDLDKRKSMLEMQLHN